jgi:primosomal protein N' (replication factor Y)
MPIIQVALASPFRRLFDYNTDEQQIMPGMRVSVPFGNQKSITGIAIQEIEQSSTPTGKLRSIHQVLDTEAALSDEILSLCQWCSNYYHYPLGEVCHLALPAALRKPEAIPTATETFWEITNTGKQVDPDSLKRATKQKAALFLFKEKAQLSAAEVKRQQVSIGTLKALTEKGFIGKKIINQAESYSEPPKTVISQEELLKEAPLTLNNEQHKAVGSIKQNSFGVYLLDGITGSGKTEVYLQAIEKILRNGRQVLVLVPEIGLTPQTVARFEKRFKLTVDVLHSGLTDKQRLSCWQAARHNQTKIIIGTRSSIFTPLPELGLIVVDEEHDLSYKQQEGVRYSARDLAIVRAQKRNIPLILGSATPSFESIHNAQTNRYQHLTLRKRANNQTLPIIKCIDSSEALLSESAITQARETLAAQQQVLIFINRRGYAPTLICQDCGWISQCPNCDSRMTLHRSTSKQGLHCHHCDTKTSVPHQCPNCHSQRLQAMGAGTQRSEEQLEELFPHTPILRIDRDSISRKGQLESALAQINSGEPCIMVGTQMLAKGHHFPKLGLAIILGLDSAFFSSDFRGAERMGQLLTQVAGRTGREHHQGTVLIQTQFPDHPLLSTLVNTGYHSLAKILLPERKLCQMPPYEHLALIRCHAQQPDLAHNFLQEARRQAEILSPAHNGLQYLGPFPSAMEKRNNRYHFILQIKTSNRGERQHLLKNLCERLEATRIPKGLHWLIDVDPQEF